MDTRNSLLSAVAIFIVIVGGIGGGFPVFAGSVYAVYGGDFNLPILDPFGPGSLMTEAVIEVPGSIIIYDLDVGISIIHTNVFDLQIFLQSPSGTRICLNMYDPFDVNEFPRGEDYKNYTNTIFDDEAQVSVEEAHAPFTGWFRPIKPYKLSEFDSQDAYGPWRLQIYDKWPADTGTLESFELMVTVPEPATVMLLVLGAGLMYLRNPRRNHHSR